MFRGGGRAMRWLAVFFLVLFSPQPGRVQIVPVKTVPVLEGPSPGAIPHANLLLSGLDFVLSDRLASPFFNPARGALVGGIVLGSQPSFFHASGHLGQSTEYPLFLQFASGRGFGGISVAFQQAELFSFSARSNPPGGEGSGTNSPRASNYFMQVYGGRALQAGRWWFGVGLTLAHLNGLTAVPLLYNRELSTQLGYLFAASTGLLHRSRNGHEFDATFLVQKYQMDHTFPLYVRWDLIARPLFDYSEKDKTVTLAWQMRYTVPLGSSGARLGWQVTVNRKFHPKIPNYSLMNIPRDPARTWAFQWGMGFSRRTLEGSYGLEFIFEPIWSHTWVQAVGSDLRPLENFFRFRNWQFHFAASTRGEALNVGAGIRLHRISYRLRQIDRTLAVVEHGSRTGSGQHISERKASHHWLEWAPYV